MRPIRLFALVGAVVIAAPAAAEPAPPEVALAVDVPVTLAAAGGAYLFALVRHNAEPGAWGGELFGGLDERVRRNFSARARVLSDVALVTSIAVPAGFAIGSVPDRAAGERGLVFAESIAGALLLTSATKTLVGRPRPYTYRADPAARRHAERRGRDARRSLFSGHVATAFAAVAAGGALYAGREGDRGMRALAWGSGAFAAAATANLRIRAGEHFYSDVVIGAVVGAAAGTLVPALHTGGIYAPSGVEWAAIGGGLVAGLAASQLVPLGSPRERRPGDARAELAPLVLPGGGAGLGVLGSF